jgi:putative phosphoesterase
MMGAHMVLAIVSDTHLPRGARRLPEACLKRLRSADAIVHAGDVSTAQVLAELRALGPPLTAVHGNVDEPALRAELPVAAELRVGGLAVGVVHDAGPAAGRVRRLRDRFPDAAAVIFGHSHIPLHEREGGFQIFNPGSPTDRRRQAEHTMGIARVEDGQIEFQLVSLGR